MPAQMVRQKTESEVSEHRAKACKCVYNAGDKPNAVIFLKTRRDLYNDQLTHAVRQRGGNEKQNGYKRNRQLSDQHHKPEKRERKCHKGGNCRRICISRKTKHRIGDPDADKKKMACLFIL